jgi:hypothetical protein
VVDISANELVLLRYMAGYSVIPGDHDNNPILQKDNQRKKRCNRAHVANRPVMLKEGNR